MQIRGCLTEHKIKTFFAWLHLINKPQHSNVKPTFSLFLEKQNSRIGNHVFTDLRSCRDSKDISEKPNAVMKQRTGRQISAITNYKDAYFRLKT